MRVRGNGEEGDQDNLGIGGLPYEMALEKLSLFWLKTKLKGGYDGD